MNSNLNSNQNSAHEPLVDRALMGLDLAAEHHLATCPCCQGERERTERALQRYAETEREQASRHEAFWTDQAARIRGACRSIKRRPSAAAVLVPALALLLLLTLELVPRSKPQAPPANAKGQSISDQDLLLAVERAVDSGTPYALEPVAFSIEVGQSHSAGSQKGVSHSNLRKEPASHVE